jgi:hypothetical protein
VRPTQTANVTQTENIPRVPAADLEVIAMKGNFLCLVQDRGSHFWLTPKAGEVVGLHRLTLVGRALRESSQFDRMLSSTLKLK